MGNVLHRTTLEYLESVNTPNYPIGTWIHNPDLTAVQGNPIKYWSISGDVVSMQSGFTKYNYSINTATANGIVDVDALKSEIISDTTIVTTVDDIYVSGMSLDIWFIAAITNTEQTALDVVVAAHTGTPLLNIIKTQQYDMVDLQGKNFYKWSGRILVNPNTETIFLTSFASYLYIQGGGYEIFPEIYQNGLLVTQKPEDGDKLIFDLVDIDNVLGYGEVASVTNVVRANNVVTITTSAPHTFAVNDLVHVDVDDDSFDEMEIAIATIPDNTHFTYNQTAADISLKTATGSIGKIIILSPFVAGDYIAPRSKWEIMSPDGKLIPPGVFLRMRIIPTGTGSTDYVVNIHYNMRTYPI